MRSPNDPPKVRFEITEHRPEDDPAYLAQLLAEALTKASLSARDAESFSQSAAAERQKARQFRNIIFQLKERDNNPPARVSRMDPLAEYDLEMVQEEFETYRKRAQELQEESDKHRISAEGYRRESERLQRQIMELRKRSK